MFAQGVPGFVQVLEHHQDFIAPPGNRDALGKAGGTIFAVGVIPPGFHLIGFYFALVPQISIPPPGMVLLRRELDMLDNDTFNGRIC